MAARGRAVTNYGTLIGGGYALPITYMSIVGGTIRMTAVRGGYVPAYEGPATVIGQDGVPLTGVTINVKWQETPFGMNLVVPIVMQSQLNEHPILQGEVEHETRELE